MWCHNPAHIRPKLMLRAYDPEQPISMQPEYVFCGCWHYCDPEHWILHQTARFPVTSACLLEGRKDALAFCDRGQGYFYRSLAPSGPIRDRDMNSYLIQYRLASIHEFLRRSIREVYDDPHAMGAVAYRRLRYASEKVSSLHGTLQLELASDGMGYVKYIPLRDSRNVASTRASGGAEWRSQ